MSPRSVSPRSLTFAALLALTLTGCATHGGTPPLYHWGNFHDQQYAYFKGEQGPEEGILQMEKIREQAKAKGRALPPGFQAHLGMLYGLTGKTDLFEQHLQAERQQFPESAAYVDFLLKTRRGAQ